jgi:hypothetical protein
MVGSKGRDGGGISPAVGIVPGVMAAYPVVNLSDRDVDVVSWLLVSEC